MTKTTSARSILWANVSALMRHKYGKENLTRLAADCKLGPGTASRIKEQKTSVGIDVVETIARKFGIDAWQLLVPGMEADNPPVIANASAEHQRLIARLRQTKEAIDGVLRAEGNTRPADL